MSEMRHAFQPLMTAGIMLAISLTACEPVFAGNWQGYLQQGLSAVKQIGTIRNGSNSNGYPQQPQQNYTPPAPVYTPPAPAPVYTPPAPVYTPPAVENVTGNVRPSINVNPVQHNDYTPPTQRHRYDTHYDPRPVVVRPQPVPSYLQPQHVVHMRPAVRPQVRQQPQPSHPEDQFHDHIQTVTIPPDIEPKKEEPKPVVAKHTDEPAASGKFDVSWINNSMMRIMKRLQSS